MALTLDQIRKNNPAFAGTTDEGLIKYLHKTSYSDMPFEELAKKVGYAPKEEEAGIVRSYATIPMEKGVGNVGRAVGYGLEASEIAPKTGRLLQESADELDTTLTARQSKQAQQDAQWKTFDDNNNFQGFNAGSISQQVFQSLPDMAVMGVVGQGMAKAIEGGLKVAGTIPEIAKWVGTSIGFGAAEGVDAGASNAAQTQQEIRKTPIDVLSKTQAFQETLANETDPKLSMTQRQELARDLVARKAGDYVFQDTSVKTGLISSSLGGGGLGMLSRGTSGGVVAGALKGIGLGAGEEALQSGEEQRTQNQARKDYINPNQNLSQGVLNARVEGAMTGGILGIGEGGGAGAKAQETLDVSAVANIGQAQSVDEAITAMSNGVNKPVNTPKTPYDEAFKAASQQHGVPEDFLKAVAMQESGIRQFDEDGKTVTPGISTAIGVMQIIPRWHPEFDVGKLASDPAYNIDAGAQFLGQLLKKHNGNLEAAAKDYYGSTDPAANDKYASEVLARLKDKQFTPAQTQQSYNALDEQVLNSQVQVQSPLSMTTNLEEIQKGLINEQENKQTETQSDNTVDRVRNDNGVGRYAESVLSTQNSESLADNRESGDTLSFFPTHETSDGLLVQKVGENTYIDEQGDEIIDDYAEPIKPKGIDLNPEGFGTRISSIEDENKIGTIKEIIGNKATIHWNSGDVSVRSLDEIKPILPNTATNTATNATAIGTGHEQPAISTAQAEIDATQINPTLHAQPAAQGVNQNPIAPVTSSKRYGEVGGKLEKGEVVLTATGRETTPYPQYQSKNGTVTAAHTRLVDNWLFNNAAEEAKARGDDLQARKFKDSKENVTTEHRDLAQQYLFNKREEQAPVEPTDKKNLTVQSEQPVTQPTGGAIAPDAGAQTMATVNNPNVAKIPAPKQVRVPKINPAKDNLIQAIAKMGGINTEHAVSQGLDVANGKLNRKFGSGILRTFNKTSKETFDGMAEALRQYGYTGKDGKELDAETLLQAVSDSVNSGVNYYTPDGYAAIAKEAQEEKYTSEEAEFSLRVQSLLDKAAEVSEAYRRQIERSIAKGYVDYDSIAEYEAEADDIIEAKTKTDSSTGADEVAAEPIATSYTESEIKQREQKQQQRDLAEQKTKREETGGQNALVDEFMGAGQNSDVFGMTNPLQKPETKASDYGKSNKLFTEDAANKARALLKTKLGQLSSGLDPELMQAGITLAGYHIEAGAREFGAYSKAMIDDLGEAIKPYLRSFYEGVRWYPGLDNKEMTPSSEIDSIESKQQSNTQFTEIKESPEISESQSNNDQANAGDWLSKAQNFSKLLLAGQSFKSILLARKALGGETILPGTIEAKKADEAIELAGVLAARKIVGQNLSQSDTFDALVKLSGQMPSLNVRTSESIAQQAYSTPLPLAYVAAIRAGITKNTTVVEPAGGNGALLITANPKFVVANELNDNRVEALKSQGFEPFNKDATTFNFGNADTDVVIANPPFGVVKDENGNSKTFKINDQYSTNEIDHAIALNSLKAMDDNGRSVLIVGAPAKTLSDESRSDAYNGKAKRAFYYTLYNEYNVTDHFTVSGDLYAKQGAAWPVDVIVIEGRGKSALALPAVNVPRLINSNEELKNELTNSNAVLQQGGTTVGQGETESTTGDNEGVSGDMGGSGIAGTDENGDNGSFRPGFRSGTGKRRSGPSGINTKGKDSIGTEPTVITVSADKVAKENKYQVEYTPGSKKNAIGTLSPINMVSATEKALTNLKDKVGDIDDYAAKMLDYTAEELERYFSAEQVDAIALALKNINDDKGFIIGDQTGIGKGRVNAAMIRYAMKNKLTPIFVTEKDNLYGDMMRDLADIGMSDIKPFITNSGFSMPMDDDAMSWISEQEEAKNEGIPVPAKYGKFMTTSGNGKQQSEMERIENDGLSKSGYDVIFTTYSQIQDIGGADTNRGRFLRHMVDGGLLILDESHNACGVSVPKGRGSKNADDGEKTGRAAKVREFIRLAKGVFYSSATYAKRPDVLDLYSKTDMGLVANPKQLVESLQAGGVPLQQVVSSMLAETGQYIRREKSFNGIAYDTKTAEVDKKTAERASMIMREIMTFDELKGAAIKKLKEDLKSNASTIGADQSTGAAGAESQNFTSVMHNMISQMLLMLKTRPAIEEAIAALKRGEKPVITLANTMGSAIDDFVRDTGINPGDEITLHFGDLLSRYLDKSRRVTEKDAFGNKTSRYLTDQELGTKATSYYKKIQNDIFESDFSGHPVSPVDFIHAELAKAGYKSGEITGRSSIIDYSGNVPIFKKRPQSQRTAAGKRKTIADFNNGLLDVVILNQSGATGLSLHASPKVGTDTRKRLMIILQPEANIDTHMQMLGRINRTGQIVLPHYLQLMGDIPAEKRIAAILSKKMAMLNATTTAAKDSAVKSKEAPDFMNQYGDQVVASLMNDNREIHNRLGSPLAKAQVGEGFEVDGAMRKITGRIPVLTLQEQESVYAAIEDAYNEYIDELNKTGQNGLEAQTMPLDAKTLETKQVIAATGNDSPFSDGVNAEIVDVKKLGKPYTLAQIEDLLRKNKFNKQALLDDINTEYGKKLAELQNSDDDNAMSASMTETNIAMLDEKRSKLLYIVNNFEPGKAVLLTSPQGIEYLGYVGKFERKGMAKNYFALGQWKLTTYVADSAKQYTLPLSKFSNDEYGWDIELADKNDVNDALESGQSATRETRTILTGNMLAAYGFDRTGQIINYEKDNGEIGHGVLMPRKFNLEQAIEGKPVKFTTPDIAIDFVNSVTITDHRMKGLRSKDNSVRITFDYYGDPTLWTPKSKRGVGGQIYLNSRVTDITGSFVSRGNEMKADIPKRNLPEIIRAIYPIINDMQPVSKETGEAFLAARGISKFSKTEEKVTGSTVEQVISWIPNRTKKLVDKGIINVVQSIKDIPESVEGFYEPATDKLYLIADSLSERNINSVLAHELFHRALVVDPKLKSKVDSFKDYFFHRYMQASKGLGSSIENMAYKRIINADTPMQDRPEEFMAYMVSEYMRNPDMLVLKMKRAIERFIGHVRAILIRSGLDLGLIKELTPADLAAMAMRYGTSVQRGSMSGNDKYHTAWHGSPHDHNKFDSGKIGTGEGAQAFGYGHYFTDKKGIAEYYRNNLSRYDLIPTSAEAEKKFNAAINFYYGSIDGATDALITANGDIGKAIDSIRYFYADTKDIGLKNAYLTLANMLESGELNPVRAGKLYQVELAPTEDEYLDWDKPLSKQSKTIKELLKEAKVTSGYNANLQDFSTPQITRGREKRGSNIYAYLEYIKGSQEAASQYLHSIGIRGIRYKAEQGKSEANNYVIFDDADISITDKYSVAMPQQITNVAEQGDAWLKGFLSQANKDSAIYNLQDRYIDLKRQMERVVSEGGEISENANPYRAEELYHQRRQSRIDDFYAKEVNPILNDMHEKGITIPEFEEFLHARHAPSRNKAMAEINPSQEIIDKKIAEAEEALDELNNDPNAKPKDISEAERELRKWNNAQPFYGTEEQRLSLSGMSDEEAADYMDSLPEDKLKELESLGDAINKINDKTLDIMVNYGLETEETIDIWRGKWEHYVPLHRDEAHPESNAFGHPVGKGFSVSGSGVRSATGSNADVTNILAHIMQAREQMITRGEKNNVSIALAEFIKENPDKDFAELNKFETHKKIVDGLVEDVRDPFFVQKAKDNVLVYRENGQDKLIVFNEKKPENVRLALSLKNMDGVEMDKVETLIGKGTRWMAKVNTQYNLVWGLFNLTRDTQGMALNLESTALHGKQKQVLGLMPDSIKTIFNVTRGGQANQRMKKLYDDFRHDGGTTGYVQMFDNIEERSKSLQKELDLIGAGKVSKSWHWIIKAISDVNTIMENGTRFAVYMSGRENGLSRMESASLSKNITVNFNRKGAYTTKIGAFYAFFNASMQGTFRTVETLSSEKGKQILMGGVALGAITTLIGLAAMGDDEWEKIPEFVRERSLIIPTGKKTYVSIPMPLGFHILPNIGRKFVESFLGSDRVKPQRRFMDLAGSTIGAFNPLGGSDISGALMPTVLDPALALWRNKDWTGKPVYREDFNSLKPTPGFTRKKDSATWGAKKTAYYINMATGGTQAKQGFWSPTPDQIDYVVGQITGGTGREIMKAEQVIESAFTGEEVPTYKIPLVGKLIGSTGDGVVESTLYYENVKRLNEHDAELKYLRQNGNSRDVISYIQDNPEAKNLEYAKGIEKNINKMKKLRSLIIDRGGSSKNIDKSINEQMKKLNDKLISAR